MTATKARVLRVNVHTPVLRVAIAFSGMTQRELALKAGVSRGEIGMLANGSRTTCKAATADKLCKAFDLKALKIKPTDMFEVKVFRAQSTVAA